MNRSNPYFNASVCLILEKKNKLFTNEKKKYKIVCRLQFLFVMSEIKTCNKSDDDSAKKDVYCICDVCGTIHHPKILFVLINVCENCENARTQTIGKNVCAAEKFSVNIQFKYYIMGIECKYVCSSFCSVNNFLRANEKNHGIHVFRGSIGN